MALTEVYVRQSVSAGSTAHPSPRGREQEIGPRDRERFQQTGVREEPVRVSGPPQPFEDVYGRHDHLVIEGQAGQGKTSLVYDVVRRLAEAAMDPAVETFGRERLVPLLLPARVLAEHLHLHWVEMLQAAVVAEYSELIDSPPPASWFTSRVAGHRWLIAVDALDEIPGSALQERLLLRLANRMSRPGNQDEDVAKFLVTTRPLAAGEIGRLHGGGTGFYELQPFDDRALKEFARKWFGASAPHEGEREADAFLEQVRAAGLAADLRVPLLATVAARVYQTRDDHTLPPSRYELYEAYFTHYAPARTAASSRPDGSPERGMLEWLNAHRTELLERLGIAYTTTDAPLLQVARNFVTAHPQPPASPESTSADRWERLLSNWLASTGIVHRQGSRLRFRHQTFAEHLAATARAKDLPVAFTGDEESPWDRLIRDLVMNDKTVLQVVLHYLHLQGAGCGLLDWLQQGNLPQRDKAAELIEKGAPCDEAHLGSHLDRVERMALVGADPDLTGLVARVRHESVRARLQALLAQDIASETKIDVIGLLRDHPATRRDGEALLHRLVDDSQPSDVRLKAARELARLDGEHRERAQDVLTHLATDPVLDADDRRSAAEELSELGDEYRPQVVQALVEIVADGACNIESRRRAAEQLAAHGADYRVRAVALLLRTPGNSIERAEALAAAARIDPEYRHRAAEALLRCATDPTLEFWYQYQAAERLIELGGEHRAQAAEILLQIITSPTTYDWIRLSAAQKLTEFGDHYRRQAIAALLQLLDDPIAEAWVRRRAAVEFAKIGDEHRGQATAILFQIATDPVVDIDNRHSAAMDLINLGGENREHLESLAEAAARNPAVSAEEGIWGTIVLVSLKPGRHAIAATLYRLAMTPAVDNRSRLEAISALAALGPWHRHDILEIIYRIISVRESFVSPLAGHNSIARRLLGLDSEYRHKVGQVLLASAAIARWSDFRWKIEESARLGDEYRDQAIAMLSCRASFAVRPTSKNCMAAEMLAQFGGAHRDLAIDLLVRTLSVSIAGDDVRGSAAATLIKIGGQRNAAIARKELLDIGTNPLTRPSDRRQALEQLAGLGGEHRSRAIDALLQTTGTPLDQAFALATAARVDPRHRDRAAEALRRLTADLLIEDWDRRDAATKLTELGAEYAAYAVEPFLQIAADPMTGHWLRITACERLAAMGEEHRDQAAKLLLEIADAPAEDGSDRIDAALELSHLGNDQRYQAMQILSQLAANPHLHSSHRRNAADKLAKMSREHRAGVAKSLLDAAIEVSHDIGDRRLSGLQFAKLGDDHWRQIKKTTKKVLGDPYSSVEERIWATGVLSALESEGHLVAAASIHQMAVGPAISARTRLNAAVAMKSLEIDQREQFAEILYLVTTDVTADEIDRFQAIEEIASLGGCYHESARKLLLQMATDPFTGFTKRLEAATRLDELTEDPLAPQVLASLASDHLSGARGRCQAAEQVAISGGEHYVAALQTLTWMATDPAITAQPRYEAAVTLAKMGGDHRALAIDTLQNLVTDIASDLWTRSKAANLLVRLGGDHHAHAIEALTQDPGQPADHAFALVAAARLDPLLRDAACQALRRAIESPTISISDRQSAAAELAKFGPAHRATAVGALQDLAADPSADPWLRRTAAKELAGFGEEHRVRAAEALLQITVTPAADIDERRSAALSLSAFGRSYRTRAADALLQAATDPAIDISDRCLLLQGLPAVDPSRADEAVNALSQLSANKDLDPFTRHWVAESLIRWGSAARTVAEQLLRRSIEDDQGDAWNRLWAAQTLADLGVPARATAVAPLEQISATSEFGKLPQALATVTLIGYHQRHHHDAIDLLTDLAADSSAAGWERQHAAVALAQLHPHHHRRATRLLRLIGNDPHLRAWERRQAHEQLARFGTTVRGEAIDLLTALVDDEAHDPWERNEAALALAELSLPRRPHLAQALAQNATTSAIGSEQRLHAAQTLTKLGPDHRHDAAEALNHLASDPASSADDRRRAVAALAALGGSHLLTGTQQLRLMTTDPDVSAMDQAMALDTLTRYEPHKEPERLQAWFQLATAETNQHSQRRHAAKTIAAWTTDHRTTALKVLRQLTRENHEPFERAMSQVALAELDASERPAAMIAIDHLITDHDLSPDQHRRLLQAASKLRPRHRHIATFVLYRMSITPNAESTDRLRAAENLATVIGVTGRIRSMPLRPQPPNGPNGRSGGY